MVSLFKRIFFGLFFTLSGVIAAVGAFILISDPQTKNPLVAQAFGVVMGLLAICVFSFAFRVLFNRQRRGGGRFSPTLLRLFAIFFVAMPTFMVVTGRSASWT